MTTVDPSGSLEIPFTASSRGRDHVPEGEVYVGVRTPGTEVPERAALIEAELIEAGARRVEAEPQPDNEALALHDPVLIDWLRGAWSEWEHSGLAEDPGADRVTPYLFPHPGLLAGMRPAAGLEPPASVAARAGLFAYDTMTLIGPGTWEAARGALDAALGAADLVAAGEPLVYALCRPPGHHATRSAIGGSCYLNNAAAAAARLRERLGGSVAVLDIDAHHGNGTQQIFWGEGAVLTGSVHVDPGAGWFPHYLGFAGETGTAEGDGANRNVPLAPGSGDDVWLEAVGGLARWATTGEVGALVVALGVDAAAADPESPLEVTAAGYRQAGELLGALSLPTVVVQEGGYDLETLGPHVREALSGLAD